MILVSDGGSTKCDWAVADETCGAIVRRFTTEGMNPFARSREEIAALLRNGVAPIAAEYDVNAVYLYGAGAAFDKIALLRDEIAAAIPCERVEVHSDMEAAVRATAGRGSGVVCILGTGSNSCLYDGKEIIKTVAPLGYVLGDEGSGAYLGKNFIADMLKGLAPKTLVDAFYEKYNVTPPMLMDAVYSNPLPNRALARYSEFLAEHLDNAYVYQLVYAAFMRFFTRNIAAYNYKQQPICFVGSVCMLYRDVLAKAAADFGITIAKAVRNSMPGIIEYHVTAPTD